MVVGVQLCVYFLSPLTLTMVLREVPVENITRPLGRNEVIGLLFRLTIFGAVTYFTIKWMVDAIDPTRKQKLEAQKQVRSRMRGQRGHFKVNPLGERSFFVFQAEKLMRQIGVTNVKLSEYEMSIAAHLVDPLSMQVNPRQVERAGGNGVRPITKGQRRRCVSDHVERHRRSG